MTPQRIAILECLNGNKCHPSAEEIYHAVKDKFPTMSFATVYNNLEALLQRGNILSLTIDSKRMRYDPNTSDHHHLICLECRKIVDIHIDVKLHIPDDKTCDFDILGNQIVFYGNCPDCRGQEEA